MATAKHELIKNFTSEKAIHHCKIPIIGPGAVGVACAISILLKGLSDELVLVQRLPTFRTPWTTVVRGPLVGNRCLGGY